MGSFVEYVAKVLGLDAHSAMERIRVARALVRLPATFAKIHAGELSWSAVRELSRVVTPETEREWLGACAALGVRDIERLVSGRRAGDLPSSPADTSARLHAVRYEVSGSTLALVRQAQDEHRRRTGQSLDEDVFVAEMAKAYLGAQPSSGAAAQVMLTVCPSCRQATADAGGEPVALEASEVDRLACDARVVPGARVAEVVEQESHGGWDMECRGRGERRSHVGSHDGIRELERRSGLRVETGLSKKVRELVVRRHHGRCAVKGCSNVMCLHVHHVESRADGGSQSCVRG